MQNSHHRVVFKGEIFPGYEKRDVIQRVKALCNFNDKTMEKLFSGNVCIMKDRINLQQAHRYKAALERTGIVCHIQDLRGSTS